MMTHTTVCFNPEMSFYFDFVVINELSVEWAKGRNNFSNLSSTLPKLYFIPSVPLPEQKNFPLYFPLLHIFFKPSSTSAHVQLVISLMHKACALIPNV